MNLGDAKRKVLKMLDEKITLAITADPAAKFHDYFDIAQRQVAVPFPIVKTFDITKVAGDMSTEWDEITLPTDFREVVSLRGASSSEELNPMWIDNRLFMRYSDEGDYILEYKAEPTVINNATADSFEFETIPETHEAICFYVAALCDPLVYDKYYTQYNNALLNVNNNVGTRITFTPMTRWSQCIRL